MAKEAKPVLWTEWWTETTVSYWVLLLTTAPPTAPHMGYDSRKKQIYEWPVFDKVERSYCQTCKGRSNIGLLPDSWRKSPPHSYRRHRFEGEWEMGRWGLREKKKRKGHIYSQNPTNWYGHSHGHNSPRHLPMSYASPMMVEVARGSQ